VQLVRAHNNLSSTITSWHSQNMQPSTCHLQGSHPARGTTTDPSMWGAKGQGSTKPLVTAQIRQWGGGQNSKLCHCVLQIKFRNFCRNF